MTAEQQANWYMGGDYYKLVLEQQYLCLELYQRRDIREYWHAVYGLFTSLRQHIPKEHRKDWSERAKDIRTKIYTSEQGEKLPNLYSNNTSDINAFHEQLDEISEFYMDLTDIMDALGMVLPKSKKINAKDAALSMSGS